MSRFTELQRERDTLVHQWVRAREDEKHDILLKVLDIDEQLDIARKEAEEERVKRQQIHAASRRPGQPTGKEEAERRAV